jgi:hypothetical protein
MAEQQNTQQSNTQTFNVTEARSFLTPFVPDAKALETMPEPDLEKYHGQVRGHFDTAVEEHVKKAGPFAPNWRQAIAGDNTERLKTLERFTSPSAMFESYEAMRQKMSSGELKSNTPFPEKGSPEEQAAWRTEQGIPGKPEEYAYEPPKGLVLGEIDNEFVADFQKHAHASNLHPTAFKSSVDWYVKTKAAREEAAAQQTAQLKQETEDKLRSSWGKDYRPTKTRIEGMLDASIPADNPELRKSIIAAVETNVGFANWLAQTAVSLNPTSTMVPGDAGAQVNSLTDWLGKADKMMKENRKAYNSSEYSRDYPKYAEAYKRQTGKDWGKAA